MDVIFNEEQLEIIEQAAAMISCAADLDNVEELAEFIMMQTDATVVSEIIAIIINEAMAYGHYQAIR